MILHHVPHPIPAIHSWDSSPWQVLYIPLFCFVCVFFLTVCRVVLVFFKCVINLTSFLFRSRFLSLLLFIHLFFTFSLFFSLWLSNFSHMKRLGLADYFVCLFYFLSWNCRVVIHNFITFLPLPKIFTMFFIYFHFKIIIRFILKFTLFFTTRFISSLF